MVHDALHRFTLCVVPLCLRCFEVQDRAIYAYVRLDRFCVYLGVWKEFLFVVRFLSK